MTSLKPCPFCGGEATVERIGRSGYYYVACNTAFCCDFGKFDTEPEAIAAWNTRAELGSERIAELVAENERLRKAGYEIGYHDAMKAAKRGGTLTADDVLNAVYNHGARWQAIADELNADMGSGTCEMEPSFIEPSRLDFMQEYLCSECGEYSYMQIACDGDDVNYCPNCGRKVVSA